MKRGRLGLPRPLGLGPMTPGGIFFGQPESEDEMEEVLFDVLDDPDVGADDVTTENPDEVEEVRQELIKRTFPDSELKRGRLDNCLDDWGDNWADGSLDATGSTGEVDNTPLETLAKAANGCRGMVESNTLERPDPNEGDNE